MDALDDGTYDVIVVDAHEGADDVVHIDLAITSGARKGEVVQLVAQGLARDATSLLGLPATLRVEDGAPRLSL
jgi:hypothetical protein